MVKILEAVSTIRNLIVDIPFRPTTRNIYALAPRVEMVPPVLCIFLSIIFTFQRCLRVNIGSDVLDVDLLYAFHLDEISGSWNANGNACDDNGLISL
jgi:hypothetical protein